MDAGKAAVIGALLGGGFAALGSTVAGIFGLSQTKAQLAAHQTEADRQRRFESDKDRREPRATTYADFLGVAHSIKEQLDRHDELYEDWGAAETLIVNLNRTRAAVIIAGPPSVAEAARDVVAAFLRIGERYTPGQTRIDLDIEDKMEGFAVAAAAALDDIVEPPPITGAAGPPA